MVPRVPPPHAEPPPRDDWQPSAESHSRSHSHSRSSHVNSPPLEAHQLQRSPPPLQQQPPPPPSERLLSLHPHHFLGRPTKAKSASRASVLSSSHSNEADDERESSSDFSNMGPGIPRYPGEDTSLTSSRELAGFYMYSWAVEVFVVCGIGSFIPMTLEQLARERGVLLSDKTTPCKSKAHFPDVAVSASNALLQLASGGGGGSRRGDSQCVVYILGMEVNTASFAMYTFSLSVLVQSLVIISMSGAADHGHFRKTLLLAFAFFGAVATMLFLPIVPQVYMLGALLAIIANTCFGASFVLLNSFLPLVVRNHPSVQLAYLEGVPRSDGSQDDDDSHRERSRTRGSRGSSQSRDSAPQDSETPSDARTPLLGRVTPTSSEPDLTSPDPISSAAPSAELALSTKVSSYGIGIGYLSSVVLQCLSIFVLVLSHSTTLSLRLVIFMIGAWWLIFTIPSAFWLRSRPGPPLHMVTRTRRQACMAYFSYSWRQLGKTVIRARKLKDVVLFLAGWFMLSDGIATVGGTAILFAKTSLDMPPASVALISVIVMLSGVVGAFAWSRVSGWMGLKPAQTILVCLGLFEIVPLYGLLGYVPVVKRWGVIGLQQPWEMYPLGAVYGFALGGFSSYCRSVFGQLIPPGYEAAFYALYAITDKGSSIFGPAIVGAITDATGEIRPGFIFLALLIGATFPLMALVDVDRGRRDGIAMSKELEDATQEPVHAHHTDDGFDEVDEDDPESLIRRREGTHPYHEY